MVYSLYKYLYNNIIGRHHGSHVFGDFIWDVKKIQVDHVVLAKNIFEIMKKAIAKTDMKVVSESLVVLGEESPPGFTSVLLLDTSHCTSHCYSDRGWLAIDLFTCGPTDPAPVLKEIENEIKKLYPTLTCTYNKSHKRFHY